MRPYAFKPNGGNDVGCCPGHDWPSTRRWSGSYSSAHSKRTHRKKNTIAKRIRRHIDKNRLIEHTAEYRKEWLR